MTSADALLEASFSIAGRSALVTGASRGLGLHFAEVLGRAGARVTLLARASEALHAAAATLQAMGIEALAVAADVTDPEAVEQAFTAAESTHGPVEIVVNNAGIFTWNDTFAFTPAQWDAVLGVNLKGTWLVAQQALRRLVAHGLPGSVINISSLLASRPPDGTDHAYPASKAGVEQLTRTLAIEFAKHGIRVNAIAPGWFPTDLNRDFLASDAGRLLITTRVPLARTGHLAELDGVLLLLASQSSSYLTGQVLHVDGGVSVGNL